MIQTLKETYYGDEEKDIQPNYQFQKEMKENYPDVWETALQIEGLIKGYGVHAGGVIFNDENFTESCALMRAPSGEIITQFELHDSEKTSLIKMDLLSVEALDKIHNCLSLLLKDGIIEDKGGLRETYEYYLGIYNIERDNSEMWNMLHKGKIYSLFQMEKSSGIKAINLSEPESVEDLATINSCMRLMKEGVGEEQPLDKFARFKKNKNAWYHEMKEYGLTQEEMKILEPILGVSYGICEVQEKLMELVQIPECGGYPLEWAEKLRKAVSKKVLKEFDELEKEYYQNIKEKGLSYNLCHYVWKECISMSKSYSFCLAHCLGYSLIALQEMNLAYKYPIEYWNTACLITDSGSSDGIESGKAINYDKIAKAIGSMRSNGTEISLVNINESDYSYRPDPSNHRILYGLNAITNINGEIIEQIKAGRPYKSFKDYYNRCGKNVKKLANIALIKAGAFDEIEATFKSRQEIMAYYLSLVMNKKNNLTLQNFNGLINNDLIPNSLELQVRLFNFTKYLRKNKMGEYYLLDEVCQEFFHRFMWQYEDELEVYNGETVIKQKVWDKIYKEYMELAKQWIADNKPQLLQDFNTILFQEIWDKYATTGNPSKWEMESVCFYHGPHELANVNFAKYGIQSFHSMNEEGEIDYIFKKSGREIPVYQIKKIAGTVIAKNDMKTTISLLTVQGVVDVRFTKDQYVKYNKRLAEVLPDGKKKIVENGWFKRGTKVMIAGYRRGHEFVAKTYKNTPFHQLYKITEIKDNGDITLEHQRYDEIAHDVELIEEQENEVFI